MERGTLPHGTECLLLMMRLNQGNFQISLKNKAGHSSLKEVPEISSQKDFNPAEGGHDRFEIPSSNTDSQRHPSRISRLVYQ